MRTSSLIILAILASCRDETNESAPRIQWSAVNSTMQLVRAAVDSSVCPSGWTLLQEELAREGRGDLPPLQRAYVTRFVTLEEFAQAAVQARHLLIPVLRTLRFSVLWPCWQAAEIWRNDVVGAVRDLQSAGYTLELTLLHHDAYPVELHERTTGLLGGWAHPDAPANFEAYVESVLTRLNGVLEPGSVIYRANEPLSTLFNGYIGGGTLPPGGTRAGKSLAQAMVNLRAALRAAGERVSAAGFRPAIAVNVRPLQENTGPSAALLDHVFNWWLMDALVLGCIDDDFDEHCERTERGVVSLIGITFYGAMRDSRESVDFSLPSAVYPERALALPAIDVTPHAGFFSTALQTTITRYSTAEVRVAEIGFSSVDESLMALWLRRYADAASHQIASPAIGLHTLFSSAEFSPGEWQFHLVRGCVTEPCELTTWGRAFLEIASQQ